MALKKQYPLWMQAKPSGGGEPVHPDLSETLRNAVSQQVGHQVAFIDEPATCDSSFAPGSIGFSLKSDGVPTHWMGRLIAFPQGPESSVLAAASDLPCAVATLVTDSLGITDDLGRGLAVAQVSGGVELVEVIGTDPESAAWRLRDMARIQAALHHVDPAKAPGVEPLDFRGALDDFPDDLTDQQRWLVGHRPGPGARVLCHGRLSPLAVRVDLATPGTLVFRDWSHAVIAEPEFDLAWTLLSFWIAPFFASTRAERRGMLMIRDGLVNLYRSNYVAAAPVDEARLKFWQAYHCAVGVAEAQRDPGVLPEEVAPSLRKRFAKLSR